MHARDEILLEGVAKSFGGKGARARALAGVDLAVGRGEFVTVIGRSGSGKSTLLRIVAGLVEPDEGRVSLFGEPPAAARARKDIGLVPQSPALLPWRSVLENVRLPFELNRAAGSPEAARDPEELLAALGLGDALDRRPAALSGGMAQRVAIARALTFGPSLLLMDEPFSALDELTREALQRDFLGQWEKEQQTVLFVTHSVTEAVLLGDRVVVLELGEPSIVGDIPIDLPRPRPDLVELGDPFRELARAVRRVLAGEPDEPV